MFAKDFVRCFRQLLFIEINQFFNRIKSINLLIINFPEFFYQKLPLILLAFQMFWHNIRKMNQPPLNNIYWVFQRHRYIIPSWSIQQLLKLRDCFNFFYELIPVFKINKFIFFKVILVFIMSLHIKYIF